MDTENSKNKHPNKAKASILYEKYLNKANSLISSISKLFIIMLILLGITTFISAFKEVSKETSTCLDEKFSLVLYSLAPKITDDFKMDEALKYEIDGFLVGKDGFNAILKKEGEKFNVEYISKGSVSKEELKEYLDTCKNFVKYVKRSDRPSEFMDIDFNVRAKDGFIGKSLYRFRISDTDSKDYYILTASWQDEYILKMIRIIWNSIFLTILITPFLIRIVRKMLEALSKQIGELNSLITYLIASKSPGDINTQIYYSNNEIGILANSIKELAITLDERGKKDELTGVGNRRKLYEELEKEDKLNTSGALSILFIDIDFFKKYNDNYGHLKGDITLKEVASILNDVCAIKNTSVFRYGGEEFIIVASNFDTTKATALAEDIQVKLHEKNLKHEFSDVSDRVTLSIGICTRVNSDISTNELLLKADEAVYSSKESGRNRYTLTTI